MSFKLGKTKLIFGIWALMHGFFQKVEEKHHKSENVQLF